jgi:nucleoside-diphosphate-sugar epimerase
MKVLVTGAGGNLARVVVPALAAAGHTPRLLDVRPIDTAHELFQGDLRSPDDLARAVDGVDAVVHAAALHGIHRGHWRPRDFWAINVDGTFNLYEAAAAKVAKVVLASSMAVYGQSLQLPADAWASSLRTARSCPMTSTACRSGWVRSWPATTPAVTSYRRWRCGWACSCPRPSSATGSGCCSAGSTTAMWPRRSCWPWSMRLPVALKWWT